MHIHAHLHMCTDMNYLLSDEDDDDDDDADDDGADD